MESTDLQIFKVIVEILRETAGKRRQAAPTRVKFPKEVHIRLPRLRGTNSLTRVSRSCMHARMHVGKYMYVRVACIDRSGKRRRARDSLETIPPRKFRSFFPSPPPASIDAEFGRLRHHLYLRSHFATMRFFGVASSPRGLAETISI